MSARLLAGRPSLTGKVAVVLGTRPEIIKLAPVLRHLRDEAVVVWSGQHYDPSLSDAIFTGAGLQLPRFTLVGVGGRTRAQQVVSLLTELVELFEAEPPAAVMVQGDTNTANGGSQAGHYCGIPVVHVEAGLRSGDRRMPEEINRLITGAVADLHCCPTERSASHLRKMGVPDGAIRVTGNTIVEATLAALPNPAARADALRRHGLEDRNYVLATLHRVENTDVEHRLAESMEALGALPWPVVFPVHPRTRARIEASHLPRPGGVVLVVPPVDHATFLALLAHARLAVSDSGGVQEEVTVLKRPLVVVRSSTERPESVEAGFSVLAEPAEIVAAAEKMADEALAARLASTPSPFGDGHAGERIATETRRLLI